MTNPIARDLFIMEIKVAKLKGRSGKDDGKVVKVASCVLMIKLLVINYYRPGSILTSFSE
jgi:hypothetical protein